MNDAIHNNATLERIAKTQFGLSFDVDTVIVHQIPVNRTANATVFLTTKKQLFVYISAQSKQTLGDVKKIVTRMGLKPELFLPPKGKPNYFDDIGREHVRAVFPGRGHITAGDLIYYRTLAQYNPALVLIREVTDGEIRQFDTDAHGDWRVTTKFAYRRIKTS